MKINLGVIDIHYQDENGTTTAEVAEILEAEYGLMEKFADVHKQDIANSLAQSFAGFIENQMMGAPSVVADEDTALEYKLVGATGQDPFMESNSAIEHMFKQFISLQEAERVGIPGAPTQAALDGKSKRFASGKGPRRPSFVDSGMFYSSFKVWMTG